MARSVTLTFEEGCNKYLENCRQRNFCLTNFFTTQRACFIRLFLALIFSEAAFSNNLFCDKRFIPSRIASYQKVILHVRHTNFWLVCLKISQSNLKRQARLPQKLYSNLPFSLSIICLHEGS